MVEENFEIQSFQMIKIASKSRGGSTFGSDTMYVGGWVVGQKFWKKPKVF